MHTLHVLRYVADVIRYGGDFVSYFSPQVGLGVR